MSSPFTYLHKRSNVVDRRPTTEDLFEGEIALNTYDGKLFFKTVQNGIEDVIEIGENFDGQYASLTGVPTLLSAFTNDPGYITDYTVTLADVTQHETGITITESQISDLQNYLTSVSFGDLTSTPTTLAGYGITDAATAAQGALADSALQPGRNISTLQNNVGYLTFVSNTDVTQHQSDIRILQSQVTDFYVSNTDVTQHNSDIRIVESQITDLRPYLLSVSNTDVTQHNSDIRITESQITDLQGYALPNNAMNFTNKTGNISQWTNDANYITTAGEINDLTANVTWDTVPDQFISQSAVVQYEGNLIIFENQIGDLQAYLTAVSNTDVTQHQSDIRINQSQIVDFNVSNTDVTQHQTDLRITESQITDLRPYLLSVSNTDVTQHQSDIRITQSQITDLGVSNTDVTQHQADLRITESQITDLQAYLTSETTTVLTANSVSQELRFTDETGAVNAVDLSWAVDDTNLARLVSGTLDANTGIATFVRDDASTFTVNFNPLFDDTNLTRITTGAFNVNNGDLTLTRSDNTTVITNLEGRYLTSVSNTDVTQHNSDIRITESQITDLQAYLTAEVDPVYTAEKGQPSGTATLDAVGQLLDQTVSANNVTQHEAALTITESQISDLQPYLTTYTESSTLDDVIQRGNSTTTTAIIPFLYANQAAFPNASTYHGAIAHSHADGAMYFAHSGSWNKLANDSDIANMVETTDSVSVLSDVDTTGAVDGSILAYDNGTSTWKVNSGATSSVIAPFAFAVVNSTSNGSGTGISWSNWNGSNYTFDFTFDSAQPDTNYAVITDCDVFDNYFVEISNKTVNGFTAGFYDDTQSRTPSTFSPFTFVIYGSTPTNNILGTGNLSTDLTVSNASPGTAGLAYDSGNTALIFTPPDLSSYLTSVSNTDVTQHQTDIRITESQITDLQSYLTAEADTLATVTGRGSSTTDAITVGGLSFNAADGIQIDALESLLFNIDSDNDQTNRVFGVKTNSADTLFTIQDNGDVAIGTHTPVSKLDIREEATGGSAQIRLYNTDNSNTTTQTASLFLSPDSRGNGALIFGKKENADFSTSASRDVALVFSPVLNNAQTEAMRIKSGGEVGIGVTPLAPFHVRKSTAVASEQEVGRFETFLTGGTNGQQLLKVLANNTPTTGEYSRFESIFIDSLGSSSDASFEFNGTLTVDYATSGSSTGYYFSTPSTTGLQCSNGGVGGTTIRLYNNNVEVLEHNQVLNIAKFATQVEVEDTTNSTSATTGALIVDGGVGIASDLYVGGTITELSSIRYKENVRDLDASIIPQLRPVLYDEKDSGGKDIPGLIAEEVAEVCTNVVSYNEEGNPEGLQYSRLIPYLIDHIQKLEKRIEDLEKNG